MSHSSGDPRKVVIAALGSNALIALSKFVAAALSGSAAMLAEATHSLADTANQALLLVGMRLSSRTNPERYPLGRASERYFWAFVVSLMLFLLGGLFAIYEGVHKLVGPHEKPGNLVVSVVVLLISLALEGVSFFVASKEFSRGRGGRSIRDALFDGRDPTIPLVLLEDTGAVDLRDIIIEQHQIRKTRIRKLAKVVKETSAGAKGTKGNAGINLCKRLGQQFLVVQIVFGQ